MMRLVSKPVQARSTVRSGSHSRTPRLKIVAYRSAGQERMLKTVRSYLRAWQPEAATGDVDHLHAILKTAVSPKGVRFQADGVVHMEERVKGVDELAQHIKERHEAYKHLVMDEFCCAVDEQRNTAYLAVRYMIQNVGKVAGQEPTGRPTAGVLLEELGLNEEHLITRALVCRQLTREEAGALTYDPSAVQPPPLAEEDLYAAPETLGAQDVEAMRNNAIAWVHAWDTGADLDVLDKILAPDARQVMAYGLSRRRRTQFNDITSARAAILSSLESYPGIKDTLLGVAIADDRRAGFIHWRAESPEGTSPESQEGLDFVRFNKDNRIAFLLSFTMRPYTNIRPDAPRADKVD